LWARANERTNGARAAITIVVHVQKADKCIMRRRTAPHRASRIAHRAAS
jgi:hypothetical protein